MIDKEETFLERNKLAATLGTDECQEVLKQKRDELVAKITKISPSANDPYAFNLHYWTGALQAITNLIELGKNATKPLDKGKTNGRTKQLPTF